MARHREKDKAKPDAARDADPLADVPTIDEGPNTPARRRSRLPSKGGQEVGDVQRPQRDSVQGGLLGADGGSGPGSTQAGNPAQEPDEKPDDDDGT